MKKGQFARWKYEMTLTDREALNLYIEGAKASLNHRVVPMDPSEMSNSVDIIYSCAYCSVDSYGDSVDMSFAIGKVKEEV